MAATIFFTAFWFMVGFDSTFEQLAIPGYEGMGFHISTFQTILLTMYLCMINFHVNGIKSLKHLLKEISKDFQSFHHPFRSRKEYAEIKPPMESLRALMISACIGLIAGFTFEIPYIYLFNYLHFGDFLFPVYMYDPTFLSGVFWRNHLVFVLALGYALWLLHYPRQWKINYRFNRKFMALGLASIAMFGVWIYYPTGAEIETPESLGLELNQSLPFPKQGLFPQNTYIYFNVTGSEPYTEDNMDGFHVEENGLHSVNVIAKYLVFISIGYLFAVRVDEK